MRLVLLASITAFGLAGCIMDPGTRYDPHVPKQSSELKPIDPYKTDKYPDTAYEIWKRDTDRNDRIAGRNGDTYPPLFKGQEQKGEGALK